MRVSVRPDVEPVLAELSALVAQLETALQDPPSPAECLGLLKDLHEVGRLARWCRDASVALAHRAEPRISFRQMETETGVPHSTLYSRLHRWQRERGSLG